MLDLIIRCTAESKSLLNGAICAPYYIIGGFESEKECEHLIDPNGLNRMTQTEVITVNADFTYKLDEVKAI